jgi:excisionase family DNA binding protein
MSHTLTPAADASSTEPALLDVNQLAVLLNCSSRHIYRMADAGKMPTPIRLCSLVRWSRVAIDEWIRNGCPNCRRAGK